MIRDRLGELRLRRKGTWNNKMDYLKVPGENEKSTLIADLLRVVTNIQTDISELNHMVGEMKILQSNIITSPLSNESNKAKLEDAKRVFNKLTSDINLQLRKVNPEVNHYCSSGVVIRMQDNHHSALKKRLQSVLCECRKAEADFEDMRKARLRRQLSIVGRKATNEELESLLNKDNDATFTQSILGIQDLQCELAYCQQKEKDMKEVEKKVTNVHELFHDLKTLVHDQGDVIDNIELKVSRSQSYVENGKVHLKKAKKSKRKIRKWKAIIGGSTLITVLTGLVVILIILL